MRYHFVDREQLIVRHLGANRLMFVRVEARAGALAQGRDA
jgi:hypothetical protein